MITTGQSWSYRVNNREVIQALLVGDQRRQTPQWLMAFADTRLALALVPEDCQYDGYSHYPAQGAYPFSSIGESRLLKQSVFNARIGSCAFPEG